MKFKKLLCFILTVCLMLSVLSVASFADTEDENVEDATADAVEDTETSGETANDPTEIVIDESGMTGDGTTGNPDDLVNFALVSENDNLAFYLNDVNGFFAIQNKKTGAIWYSNPLDWEKDLIAKNDNMLKLQSQLIVTYLNSSYDIITIMSTEAHIVSEHVGEKQILTYVFSGATRNFSIPVSYELKEDYLDVQLMVDHIEENSDARITQIALLPCLGAAGFKDTGYALIPDGSGSLMEYNKICKNISQYTGYIYNRDITASSYNTAYVDLNETVSLPVYGMYKNGAGFLSIITEGEGTSAIKANVSRIYDSYNYAYSHIVVRDTQTHRNATGSTGIGFYYSDKRSGNLSLRVYPLDAEESDYVGMAQKYKEYLVEEEGLTHIEDNQTITNALNIDLFCAVKTPTHFLGIPYTGVKSLTTFDDVQDIITQLKGNNIDNLTITLTGWNSGGLESAVPLKFKTEGKVGSTKDAKNLVAFAKEQNVNVLFDVDVQGFYSGTSKIKKFKHTAFSLANTPVTVYPFSKSLNRSVTSENFYHLIHPKYMVDFADDFVTSALSNGISNFSFKTAGTDPYATYNKNNMLTRDNSVYLMKDLFNNVDEKTEGIISTKVGNSFVLSSVDNIVEAPVYSSNLIMSQTSVPFYQIALRGFVNMASTPLNLSSEVSELELKCAETGLSLYYQLMKSESTEFQNTTFTDYYACSYDDYYDIVVDTYGRMKEIYDAVGASEISDHEIITNDLRVTTYSNGVKVYVNYDTVEAAVGELKIPARGFYVVGGDN